MRVWLDQREWVKQILYPRGHSLAQKKPDISSNKHSLHNSTHSRCHFLRLLFLGWFLWLWLLICWFIFFMRIVLHMCLHIITLHNMKYISMMMHIILFVFLHINIIMISSPIIIKLTLMCSAQYNLLIHIQKSFLIHIFLKNNKFPKIDPY